ncbi:hypothetical protein ES702_05371 [subsurface metagenome]
MGVLPLREITNMENISILKRVFRFDSSQVGIAKGLEDFMIYAFMYDAYL